MGVAPDGIVTMVWFARTNVGVQVRASSRPRGGAWAPPVGVSGSDATGYDPRLDVAVDGAGTATSVWRDYENDVILASSRSAGGAWTTPVPLSTGPLAGYPPRVAAAADGHVWAVWVEDQGGTIGTRVARRNPGGAWSPPVDLTTAAGGTAGPTALAASVDGDFVLVGIRANGSQRVVVSARTVDASRWSQLTDISTGDVLAGGPDAAVDAAGNAVAAWIAGAQDSPRWVQAAGLDAAGPVLGGFSAPATGMVGTAATFSAVARDVWSPIVAFAWTFGDGEAASGASVAHAYETEGRYTVSLTITDGVGNITTRSGDIDVKPPKIAAPRITRFDLTRPSIRLTARTAPKRTKLQIGVTAQATVKVLFESMHKHRIKSGKRYHRVVMRRSLPAGRSSISVKARVGGEALFADTYVLTGRATNSAGTSPKRRTRLHVVDPRHSW